MKRKFITFLKTNPKLLHVIWGIVSEFIFLIKWIIPINKKRIIFSSFGGRKFDDSPKALYDAILKDPYFNDWDLIWCFEQPNKYNLIRGRKVRIDTFSFIFYLLSSKVWIDNSGIERGINIKRKKIIKVRTWHGAPLKKIGGEENSNSIANKSRKKKEDASTIRCAQSEYDREIFARIFHCNKDSILLSDLPRNDYLAAKHTKKEVETIKKHLGISLDKKIILYMPTYREYLVDNNMDIYIKPPIDFKKWEEKLSDQYIVLVRAHYAVTKCLNIEENNFVKDVSQYPFLNHLYLISDEMISDYSSSFFDYSILDRPMYCFAYDLDEYSRKRGLYVNLSSFLPCDIFLNEDLLLKYIISADKRELSINTHDFHKKYAGYAGNASKLIIDEIKNKLL